MTAPFITPDLVGVLQRRESPTLTLWNRLEGRPRAERFDRALRAEVRDALWLITRQWQMGELQGDDAGSPIFAKLRVETSPLTGYQAAGGAAEPFDATVPLEARVERRPVPLSRGAQVLALDVRLLLGRYWLKLLGTLPGLDVTAATAQFLARYPVRAPDPANPADATTCAHPEVWAAFAAVAGRKLDGGALHAHLTSSPPGRASDGIAALAGRETEADALAGRFVAWFAALVTQPGSPEEDAWVANRLEYQFAVSAPTAAGEKTLRAEAYADGHLDWYALDDADGATPQVGLSTGETRSMVPTPVSFQGMPNTRWWAFEDGKTNFGGIKPDTTDLPKLLLMEFGLVYANDWFIVPCTLPVGCVASVRGLAVTNVFGERTWVEATGSGAGDDWRRWAMFNASPLGQARRAVDRSLLLLPTAYKVQEGAPKEEVLLVRDELANSAWAVEKTVWLPDGSAKPGAEAATELRAFLEQDLLRVLGGALPPPPPVADGVKLRYQVMNTVPEQWIPFIPVHLPDDVRQVQLQRAALPRILQGDPRKPLKVEPRTALMREGLDATPARSYFVHEEEVPRAGARVTQGFQRTRWTDGSAWVWLGIRKQAGRGEASSGLAFDQAVDVTGAG
ncbi:hypothetical protein HJC10_28105 [Corallococcus exiguus]|uniref:hypothetical protein n=1 Tax=Corallococcus TaxID=83461 RepID=UPI000EBE01E8|nr:MULTISPECIES: hypothetical protein [Corallococcus]NNB90570.1 hypothetical protein [Corallococcus exiguus]NNB98428.1 hypothetical protein [Corallococcus exiguus]NNC06702.1 hypothetical protein [Corallococcus exiguus]NPC52767.1 hypothetical protein [Corallococcus exiguus]RKH84780.1 hypothetical protein D7X99_07960 [Corallococcus sp. AB032C]